MRRVVVISLAFTLGSNFAFAEDWIDLVEIPVAAGSVASETCVSPVWPSACVTFHAGRTDEFLKTYAAYLLEAGWRPFQNSALLARDSSRRGCRQLLAFSVLDADRWQDPRIAELVFLEVGCSPINSNESEGRQE